MIRFVAVVLCALAGYSPASAVDTISIRVTGKPTTVFRYATDACSPEDVPDAPARAFRDEAGNVHLFATHYINRQMVGENVTRLSHVCDVVFEAADEPTPLNLNNREWLASFFTRDGRSIVALTHSEFHGSLWPNQCWSLALTDCWYNTIRFAVSRNSGSTFSQGPVLAAPYGPYASSQVGPRGFFQPSNIVRSPTDGYYYALLFANDPALTLAGSCLVQSRDPSAYDSWRAWDGFAFALRLPNTYQQTESAGPYCTTVNSLFVPTLVRHVPTGLYIGVYSVANEYGRGAYYTVSKDLITWSAPTLFYPSTSTCSNGAFDIWYASIIDPDSSSIIFDTIGKTAILFFTYVHLDGCQDVGNRDLMRIAIEIS